jgi:hypothetical protein
VQIPAGDLAPARRRTYYGGYGRRRRRARTLTVLLLLVLIGGGAAYALQRDDAGVPQRLAQPTCTPAPSAAPASAAPARTAAPATGVPVTARLPQPAQVRLALLNGTPRNGLARGIGDQLAARGFVVTAQANAPAPLAGASQVAFGPGGDAAATVVQHWVLGSAVVADPRLPRGTVRVTLGSAFTRLASPAEAARAARATRAVAPAAPSAAPRPSATAARC